MGPKKNLFKCFFFMDGPRSRQVAVTIDDVHTDFVITVFSNCIFLIVTQREKMGHIIEAYSGFFSFCQGWFYIYPFFIKMEALMSVKLSQVSILIYFLSSNHLALFFAVNVLLGARETVEQVYARNIVQELSKTTSQKFVIG